MGLKFGFISPTIWHTRYSKGPAHKNITWFQKKYDKHKFIAYFSLDRKVTDFYQAAHLFHPNYCIEYVISIWNINCSPTLFQPTNRFDTYFSI